MDKFDEPFKKFKITSVKCGHPDVIIIYTIDLKEVVYKSIKEIENEILEKNHIFYYGYHTLLNNVKAAFAK